MDVTRRVRDPIPDRFETAEDLDQFWSTHSLADYEDQAEDAAIQVRLEDVPAAEETVTISPDTAARLRRRARELGVSIREVLDEIVARSLPQ